MMVPINIKPRMEHTVKHKLIWLVLTGTALVIAAAAYGLPHFYQPSFFSATLEGALLLVTFALLWHMENPPVTTRFYKYLLTGFLLLYLSFLIDLLDEFFFQPNWLTLTEEFTLLLGFLTSAFGVYLAITYHYEQISTLEKLADTDPLTGLLNRRAIIRQLEHHTKLCQQDPSLTYSVIVADLDRFKNVNDCHGHHTGDDVLRHFAHRLAGNLRASDHVGRWGGEEFVILLPHTQESGAALVAEKIRQQTKIATYTANNLSINLSVSLGVAQWQPALDGWYDLIKQADKAMYQAKHGGRDRVCTASQAHQIQPDSTSPKPA